jgi:hypothetical protein
MDVNFLICRLTKTNPVSLDDPRTKEEPYERGGSLW